MAAIALLLFITLFAFGGQYYGWEDPVGHVGTALFASFVFGVICGFRVKD